MASILGNSGASLGERLCVCQHVQCTRIATDGGNLGEMVMMMFVGLCAGDDDVNVQLENVEVECARPKWSIKAADDLNNCIRS